MPSTIASDSRRYPRLRITVPPVWKPFSIAIPIPSTVPPADFTIEASGIGIACVVAEIFDVPVVFAKKTQTKNIAGDVYTTKVESFTHGRVYDIIVSKEFLGEGDHVLLIDDFLANGKALEGLAKLVKDSGAELVGAGVVIEKGFQPGGDFLRKQTHLESLAIVDAMDEKTGEITFRE